MTLMKHKHHIIPRYEGGSNDPENIVELTVTQHTMWHFAEFQRKGNWQDKLAVKILTGRITKEEATREAVREQNRNREHTPELRKKLAEGTKKQGRTIYCPDLDKEWLCAKDAAEELGMNHKMIYRVAMGERNKTGGLRFEFRGTKRHNAPNRRSK